MARIAEDRIIPLSQLNRVQKALIRIFGIDRWIFGRKAITKTGGGDPEAVRQEQMSLLMGEFSAYTQLSNDRHVKYADYDAMDEGSPEVASVLSLYAQEASPEDLHTRKVIWVTAKEKDLEKTLNRLIRELNLEERAWGTIRNLAKYGDCFLLNLFAEGKGEGTAHEKNKTYLRSLQYIYPGRVKRIEADTLLGYVSEDLATIIPPDDDEHNMYAPWVFCYDAETEVLTSRGWLHFKDLEKTDMIATRNLRTKQFEWQKPTEYVNHPYSGPMVKFSSNTVDLLVTPNHRMLVWIPTNNKIGTERIIKAEDIITDKHNRSHFSIPMTSSWAGNEIKNVTFNPITSQVTRQERNGKIATRNQCNQQPLSLSGDDYCALMGACLSEGSVDRKKGLQIAQRTTSKGYTKYKELFERINGGNARHNGKVFWIYRRCLVPFFNAFGYSHEKFIPDNIMNAIPRQLKIFWEYYVLGDGWFTRDRKTRNGIDPVMIATSSFQMAGQLQEIAQKLGFCATMRTFPAKDKIIKGQRTHMRKNYRITLRNTKAVTFKSEMTEYTGTIHCATVPNGVMYVRRNGKPAWCGNTHGRLMAYDQESIYGRSMCEEVRKIWKMLSILETMVALAHVQRAIDRNVFMIDVGTASEEEALALVKKYKQWLRRKEFFDPQTNQFKNDFNPTTIQEDIFWPTRPNSNSRVDTLQGKTVPQGLVDDLNYFRNKLCGGLGVPREYLDGTTQGSVFDSKAALVLQDIHFARKIERLQRSFRQMIHRICQVHLALDGVITNEFEIRMAPLSLISDRLNEDLWQRRAEVLGVLTLLATQMGWPQDVWNIYLTKNFIRDIPSDILEKLIEGIKKMVPPEGLPQDVSTSGETGNGEKGGKSSGPPMTHNPKNPLSPDVPKKIPHADFPLTPKNLFKDAFGKIAADSLEESLYESYGETETLERLKRDLSKMKRGIIEKYPELENMAKAAEKELDEDEKKESNEDEEE